MHKNDFTLAMLLRLGRVTKVDILRTEQVFYNLDKDHSGSLTKEDLHDLLATQRRRMAVRKRCRNWPAWMPVHLPSCLRVDPCFVPDTESAIMMLPAASASNVCK